MVFWETWTACNKPHLHIQTRMAVHGFRHKLVKTRLNLKDDMLHKEPKSGWKGLLKKGIIGALAIEAVFFAGTYYVWNRLNQDRDFRLFMLRKYPWVLEGYYTIGEKANPDLKIRQFDRSIWNQEGKLN